MSEIKFNEKIRERIRAINEIELKNNQIINRIHNDIFSSQKDLEGYAINGVHKIHLGQNIFITCNQTFLEEIINILRIVNNRNTIALSGDEFLYYNLKKILDIIIESKNEFKEIEEYYFLIFNEMNINMTFDNGEVLIELKDEE